MHFVSAEYEASHISYLLLGPGQVLSGQLSLFLAYWKWDGILDWTAMEGATVGLFLNASWTMINFL